MTQTETEQRLAQVELELTRMKVHVAELDVLVRILLNQDSPAPTGVEAIKKSLAVLRRAETAAGRTRPRLRLVPAPSADSVSGQDVDEALRRVRRGEGR